MYLLDKNEQILLIIHDFDNDNYKRQVNGEWSYSFEIDSKYKNYIKKKNKVAFNDKDDNLQLFIIDSIDEELIEGKMVVSCLHDYYSLNDTIIEDKRAIDATCEAALTKLLDGSDYTVGDVEEFGEYDINFYYISRLEGLKNIINTFGGELNFRYELSEDKKSIGNKIVDIKHRLGTDTGLRCCYDTNLESLKRHDVTPENHFTVLYGRGASLETENGGYTRKLNFSDVVWQTPTDPVDKPSGKNYVEDLEAIEKYGRIEGIYENDKIDDKNILLEKTWEKLQEVKNPILSYEANIKDISNIDGFEHYKYSLGDTILIENKDIDTIIEARIIEENYSIKAVEDRKNINIDVVLGNLEKGITDNINSNIDDWNNKFENKDTSIDDTNFPDDLPAIPVLSLQQEGFSSLALSWTYEAKSYYTYILYGSQIKDFNPSEDNIIYKGNGSTFWHQVGFSETWYYRVRVKNTHGKYTDFSNQVTGTTYKIKDGTTVFEDAAITEALIGTLKADRAWVGQFLGENIDARNIKVIDGNNKITFEITSGGIVKIIQGLISITDEGIRINLIDSEDSILGYVVYDGQGMQIFTQDDKSISNLTREGSYIDKVKISDLDCNQVVKIANRSGCSTHWYVSDTATGEGTGRNEENKANSLKDVLRRIRQYGLNFTEKLVIDVESGILDEDIVIQDFTGTMIEINFAKGVILNTDRFVFEDCTARIYLNADADELGCLDDDMTAEELNNRALIKSINANRLFSIRNCNYISINGFRLRGNKGNCVEVYSSSDVILKDCDISNFKYGSYTTDMSKVCIGGCRGNLEYLSYVAYGGIFSSTAAIPKCSNSDLVDIRQSGIWIKENSYTQYDTFYQDFSETTSTNIKETFEITNLYTEVEGEGLGTAPRQGYTGQGRYKNYKTHRGYIILPATEILAAISKKENYTLKLRMTRLDTKHGYSGKIPHPVIRATGNIVTDYWDSEVLFDRGDTNDITLPNIIVQAIANGANKLELWANDKQQQQYSFYNNVNLIIEGDNKEIEKPIDITQTTFSGADEMVECAMTYWKNCDNEGSDWSMGTVYRASNTVLSGKCESTKGTTNSFFKECNGNYYKAIDCSTLVGMALRGWDYATGAYGSKAAFDNLRNNRLLTNSAYSWSFAPTTSTGGVARDASQLAEYFYNLGWIIPLESINADNYEGMKKGDIIFYARKNSDGTWKKPDRFMNISHVAICTGYSSSNGNMNLIESTYPTTKVHTVGSATYSAGVILRNVVNAMPETMVLVARIQK